MMMVAPLRALFFCYIRCKLCFAVIFCPMSSMFES
jgi:hypothetical protein